MNFTKKDLDEAIKVDQPGNTANPFGDFMAVLPKGFKLNTLYKINDKNFLYVPDDKRFKEIKSIHLLRQLNSNVLISAVAFDDITITRERVSRETVLLILENNNMQNKFFFVYKKLHQTATGNGFEMNVDFKETVVFNLSELDENENKEMISNGNIFSVIDQTSSSAGYFTCSKQQLFIPLLKINVKCKHSSQDLRG